MKKRRQRYFIIEDSDFLNRINIIGLTEKGLTYAKELQKYHQEKDYIHKISILKEVK